MVWSSTEVHQGSSVGRHYSVRIMCVSKIEKAFLTAFVGKQYLLIALYYLVSKLYFVYLVWKLENKKQAVIFSTAIMAIWVATTDFKKEFNISEKDYDMIFSMGVGLLIWLWDTSI